MAEKTRDLHYDHHRKGGAPIQIDEMIDAPTVVDYIVVTTQVDADACVAAAWLQLTTDERKANKDKLRVITFDCDHLAVPSELVEYADFAVQCVAAMKANSDELVEKLNLPRDHKQWSLNQKEQFGALAFQRGAEAIIAACKKGSKFPGECGEAAPFNYLIERHHRELCELCTTSNPLLIV